MSVTYDASTREGIALPQFAPLPSSFVLHVLDMTAEQFIYLLQHAADQLQRMLDQLEQKVRAARDFVYKAMAAALEGQERPTAWFQESLREQVNRKPGRDNEKKKLYSISGRTLATWQNNHVLLPAKPEYQFLDRAGAILIASIVDERKQGYTPSHVVPSEPYYWCYAQYGPTSPVLPCPLPVPENLPAGTLLWSHWPTLDPSWSQFDRWGSMRFSSIDRKSLGRWDPSLNNRDMSLLSDDGFFSGKMRPAALKNYADRILFRMAPNLLTSLSSPSSVPMLLSPADLAQLFNPAH